MYFEFLQLILLVIVFKGFVNFVKNFISNLLFEIIPRKNFIYYPLCRIINCYSLEITSLLESFIFYKKIFSKDRSLIRSLLQQSSSSLLIKKRGGERDLYLVVSRAQQTIHIDSKNHVTHLQTGLQYAK